jgi:putative SOS response-associated peptidase YedK
MCGRFTQHYSWAEIHQFLSLTGAPVNLRARYNITPTTSIEVVRLNEHGDKELIRMRWGLVPFFWKKSLKEVPATFNARAETVAEKPMFRAAFKKRRCIIPASGFFEWTGAKTDRVPHLFTDAGGEPILGFAGLWESWTDGDSGEEVLSATIIVTSASPWMESYHDRMPVILEPDQFDAWLNGDAGGQMLVPAQDNKLQEWQVTTDINKAGVRDDDPGVLEPVAA